MGAQGRQLAEERTFAHITAIAIAMALNVALASSQHSSSSEAACEKPWVDASAAGMGCLRLESITRLGWDESQSSCDLLGGNLLEWTESADLDALNEILTNAQATGVNNWWIGGTDRAEEGNWTWAKSSKDLPSGFPWGARQPDEGTNANCLSLADDWKHQFWGDDVDCDWPLARICQRMLPLPTATPPPPACSDSWFDLSAAGMGCLKLDHTVRLNWDKSQAFCSNLGGRLLEWKDSANFGVLDDLLMDFFSDLGVFQWFIGATDRAEEGKWIWANSAEELPSDFPWADGYPHLSHNGNCLILETDRSQAPNFFGRDFACTWSLPHICQQLSA